MNMQPITAAAHPNLALVKYWGRRDDELNIPTNSSISLNLDAATSTTQVHFREDLPADRVTLNQQPADHETHARVSRFLDHVRRLADISLAAEVDSFNDFPTAAGIASSASAFAALALAASRAAGLELDPRQLSILARKGSGSASRSVPAGYALWHAGTDDDSSYAEQLAPPEHWDLRVTSVLLDSSPKEVSSSAGHRAAWCSPFFQARLDQLPGTLETVRRALLDRDWDRLAPAVEREAVSMHAVAITSCLPDSPWLSGLYYWGPKTLSLIHAVQSWRQAGIPVCFTIDAGPNVHLLCEGRTQPTLEAQLRPLMDELEADFFVSRPGRGAWIVDQATP